MIFKCLVISFALSGLVGCYDMHLNRRLHYENLDEVAVAATGKQLWEKEFGEEELGLVNGKLDDVRTDSLYCIKRNLESDLADPPGLSPEQKHLRLKNIKLLRQRALLPEIQQRESEGKRRVVMGGCKTRM